MEYKPPGQDTEPERCEKTEPGTGTSLEQDSAHQASPHWGEESLEESWVVFLNF